MFSKEDFAIPLEGELRLRVINDEINACTDVEELRKQLIVSARLVMQYQNILNKLLLEKITEDLTDFTGLLDKEDKLK